MMNQHCMHQYFENKEFQAVRFPYAGRELAMVIFLPRKSDGLPELEKSLSVQNLQNWLKKSEAAEVRLSIPKFKMAVGCKLGDTLSGMGMRTAFSLPLGADFSGMDGQKDLWIGEVLHKAYVDVHEEGTEAAAATVVTMTEGAWIPTYRFNADHPFLFLIRHEKSGAILFMGRVTKPEGYAVPAQEDSGPHEKK